MRRWHWPTRSPASHPMRSGPPSTCSNRAVVMPTDEGLKLEEAQQRKVIGKKNQMEAVAAGMAKRAPKFDDPPDL